MLREIFIGRVPSHFHVNTAVKAFIVSESFFWASWNFITPIFAVFAATRVPGGSVEIAASAYSVHLIVRVIFELISGRRLLKAGELKKYLAAIIGIAILSLAYLGLAFTATVAGVYLFYGIAGIGFGIASPAKFSLFSTHLDKNKETIEWGMYDATVFLFMALAAALGGFIASSFGFRILFWASAALNILGIIPYLLYINLNKSS
ncbi:MAG: hypothetical protein HYT83_01495 [Candidatus Levybacteria bacterium]|nr:hypothetical protein [Candidatus Levybacteria bacterium]